MTYTQLYEAIYAWVNGVINEGSPLTPVVIVQSHQNIPSPTTEDVYMTIGYTPIVTNREGFADYEPPDETTELTTLKTDYEGVVEIRETNGSGDLLKKLISSMLRQDFIQTMNTLGIFYRGEEPIQQLPRLQDHHWEKEAVLEIRFGFADAVVYDSGIIDTVEIMGDVDGRAVAVPHSLLGWVEQVNPKNLGMSGVAWSPSLNLLVAVGVSDGVDAYIVTSPDGITWTERANPKNLPLYAIIWNDSIFVAVGGDPYAGQIEYIITSPDGITWTEQIGRANGRLRGVTWSPSLHLLVAVGGFIGSYIITSPDGITWTEYFGPKPKVLNDVTWGNGLFVAVGIADGADAYIVTSPDGITWTEQANPLYTVLLGVIWGNSQFVAVGYSAGDDAYIITSPDGITWTERANPQAITLQAITYAFDQFVAVGESGYIVFSLDGEIWAEEFGPKNKILRGIGSDGEKFVAVGDNDGTDGYLITKLG